MRGDSTPSPFVHPKALKGKEQKKTTCVGGWRWILCVTNDLSECECDDLENDASGVIVRDIMHD
jgi:hypothetical protein